MSTPNFRLHQPKTLEAALDLLGSHRASVKLLAGGTDLVPRLKAGILEVLDVVSLARVPGLGRISYQEDDGLVIGAGARISEVAAHEEVAEHYPALAHACSVMATPQIRNMGTVVGNLANSAPSADTAAPLLAHDASLVIVERGGRRNVKLADFFQGPGLNILEPMEIIEAIRVPAPPQRSGSAYQRISARSRVDIAAVGVAAFVCLDMAGCVIKARLALSAVAPTPVRCPEAEALLDGQTPEPQLLAQAAAACVRSAKPIDDVRATAAYRRKLVQILAQRAIADSAQIAKGGE